MGLALDPNLPTPSGKPEPSVNMIHPLEMVICYHLFFFEVNLVCDCIWFRRECNLSNLISYTRWMIRVFPPETTIALEGILANAAFFLFFWTCYLSCDCFLSSINGDDRWSWWLKKLTYVNILDKCLADSKHSLWISHYYDHLITFVWYSEPQMYWNTRWNDTPGHFLM